MVSTPKEPNLANKLLHESVVVVVFHLILLVLVLSYCSFLLHACMCRGHVCYMDL